MQRAFSFVSYIFILFFHLKRRQLSGFWCLANFVASQPVLDVYSTLKLGVLEKHTFKLQTCYWGSFFAD